MVTTSTAKKRNNSRIASKSKSIILKKSLTPKINKNPATRTIATD
jgi:hypothetical protein